MPNHCRIAVMCQIGTGPEMYVPPYVRFGYLGEGLIEIDVVGSCASHYVHSHVPRMMGVVMCRQSCADLDFVLTLTP